jgi:regulator of sigma E protease
LNIAVAIAGLAFLILIHEAGHFFVALAVRMRPRRFYIFFPPPLVKRVRNGIEYGIGTIPLGGYVKIPGMHKPAARDLEGHLEAALEEAPWLERYVEPVKASLDENRLGDARTQLPELRAAVERAELSEPARRRAERAVTDVDDGLSGDAYWRAPVWKRVAVILAGPGTNLLFAIALLATVFMLGLPGGAKRVVDSVTENSPAEQAGLEPGDQVVAVAGKATPTFRAIRAAIKESGGRRITLTVVRDGRRIQIGPVQPRREQVQDGGEARWVIGFRPEPAYTQRYGPWEATKLAADRTWLVTKAIGASLGHIVTGSGRKEVASPVGIVQTSSQTLAVDYREYLGVLALISLSLALLNLLPFLPLDGGHIAFSLAEGVRGRAIPREAYERASAVGLVLVLFLFFIGLSNDVDRLRGG